MLTSDLLLATLMADLRIREAHHEAEQRHLEHQALRGREGWATQQARRYLHASAHLLVGLGQGLHEHAMAQSNLVHGPLDSR